tara:strand:- start:382 stop:558 length:177 start_codon:yes stop_codon:yes gene_type:complete
MKKYLSSILVVIFTISINGCEDDPLLAPQTESDEGGSYGNLSLQDADNDDAIDNPELY